MKFIQKFVKKNNMYGNEDVKHFLESADLTELNVIGRGPSSTCYEFFDHVCNEEYGVAAKSTVLLVSDEHSLRDLQEIQQKTMSLAKRGINVAPVLQYMPIDIFRREKMPSQIDEHSLYMMGIVQPRIYGMNSHTETIEDTITKFKFLERMTYAQALKSFEDLAQIMSTGLEADIENPKNIIINRYGVHFIDLESNHANKNNNRFSAADSLILLFKHLVGTHAQPDYITSEKVQYQFFIDPQQINNAEQRDEYARLQVRVFDKFSKAAIQASADSGTKGHEMVQAIMNGIEYNYISDMRDSDDALKLDF